MVMPAAKQGDRIVALDTHLVQPSGPSSPVALPHLFSGIIDGNLSGDVTIEGKAAATIDSTATNTPPHLPTPPGVKFVKDPSNQGRISAGSGSVRINGRAAARAGDPAITCNDPVDLQVGIVVATSTVGIGG
jgi:uncharacterized Zn-binding protein involved in type VI secretion